MEGIHCLQSRESGSACQMHSDSGSDVTAALPLQPAAVSGQNTTQALDSLKPVIKLLYIDKGLSFREVQKILSTQHGYNVTYVTRFLPLRTHRMYKDEITIPRFVTTEQYYCYGYIANFESSANVFFQTCEGNGD